jgi:glycosyltransferase involved in cell wall biosynthesis
MKVVLVTGIYPPDIGGPATHSADLAGDLARRGHQVVVLTLTDEAQPQHGPELIRFPRRRPWPLRFLAVSGWLWRHRRGYDVIYATGLHEAAVAGARLARRPVVVKVVGDPAWERAGRLGLTALGFEEFQTARATNLRVNGMRRLRNWWVRSATAVTAPSEYLARIVTGWLGEAGNVHVIGNGVRAAPLDAARKTTGAALKVVWVGRLVSHKRIDMLIEAVASTDAVSLELIGDGPERAVLEQRARMLDTGGRVGFMGGMDHSEVLRRLAAADVMVLASAYEGLPHVAVEALACGTPVIAPAVGGVPEIIQDEVNGLIVEDVTAGGFAAAMVRMRDDPALRERLADRARRDGESWSFERCADRLESIFRRVTLDKPRAVFLGKGGFTPFTDKDLELKLTILSRHLAPVMVAPGKARAHIEGVKVISLPAVQHGFLGGIMFYFLGPIISIVVAARKRRSAVICQSPYEGCGAVLLSRIFPKRLRPRVVVEVHGDWRIATRMYGSSKRLLIAPFAERAATWALLHADRVRVISRATENMVRRAGYAGPTDRFLAFSDFNQSESLPVLPIPARPLVAFIGALEPSKGVDVLIEAWAMVVRQIPEARLAIAGGGSMMQKLQRRIETLGLGASVDLIGALPRNEVWALLDRSWLLAAPSRSEGLGRVILEAFSRARPVVATHVGGIPELVEPGRTGLLVPPEDAPALASALLNLMKNRARVEDLGAKARERFLERDPMNEYEKGIERLASWIDAA